MYTLNRFLIDYDLSLLRALAENRGALLTSRRQAEELLKSGRDLIPQ